MSIEVHIPPFLQPLAGNDAQVTVSGRTVGDCLAALVDLHPGLKPKIFTGKGRLLKGLHIFINNEAVYPGVLTRPVRDGDRLHVTYMIMGG